MSGAPMRPPPDITAPRSSRASAVRSTHGPRRIAILLPDLCPGGAERMHLHLAREWARQGVAVDFVLQRARGGLLEQLPAGCRVVDLATPRLRGVLWPLVRYLRESPPDALLAAMWPLTVIAPIAASLARCGTRVAVSEHSPLSIAHARRGKLHRILLRASQRIAYPLAAVRIAVSRGVADDMAATSGLSRDRFVVVANAAAGTCPHAFDRAPARAGAGPTILAVGTLKKVKRHDLLIDAFARLPEHLGARLWIVGEGPERPDLERRIADRGLEGRVVLQGHSDDPGSWYAKADLFVLASDYEGFGNVLVEAMEYGLRIVSTDCPVGPADVLDGGRYGRLVASGDAQALAEAIQASLAAPVDRDALLRRAREYDVADVAARYLGLLFPADGEHA